MSTKLYRVGRNEGGLQYKGKQEIFLVSCHRARGSVWAAQVSSHSECVLVALGRKWPSQGSYCQGSEGMKSREAGNSDFS